MPTSPSIEILNDDPGQSFSIRHIIRKERPDQHDHGVWHYHPEYEITLTLKSSGKRFIGYSMGDYQVYDMVLVGENVPHCWITNEYTEQIVINFKHGFLAGLMDQLPELSLVSRLLTQSHRGIKFNPDTAKKSLTIINKMDHQKGFDRLLSFLSLLNLMANSKDKIELTFFDYKIKDSLIASSRIETIYSYILMNYKSDKISFTKLCQKLNLTKGSLCKFIKRITKKTFTELVIETRINEACKLLCDSDYNIAEICFESGFNNLSNFNRSFKRIMKMTPKVYRGLFRSAK